MAQPGTHLPTVLSESGYARSVELRRGWLNPVAARDRLLLTSGLIIASGVSPGGPENLHGYFQSGGGVKLALASPVTENPGAKSNPTHHPPQRIWNRGALDWRYRGPCELWSDLSSGGSE